MDSKNPRGGREAGPGVLETQPAERLLWWYVEYRSSSYTVPCTCARNRSGSGTTNRQEVRQARSREAGPGPQVEAGPVPIPRLGLRPHPQRLPATVLVRSSMRSRGEQVLTQGVRAWAEVVALSPSGPGSRHTDRSGGKPFKEGGHRCASSASHVDAATRVPAALSLAGVQWRDR